MVDTTAAREAREAREVTTSHHQHMYQAIQFTDPSSCSLLSTTTTVDTTAVREVREEKEEKEATTPQLQSTPSATQAHTATDTTAVHLSNSVMKSATLFQVVKEREAREVSTMVPDTMEAREERDLVNLAKLFVILSRHHPQSLEQREKEREEKEERAATTPAPVTTDTEVLATTDTEVLVITEVTAEKEVREEKEATTHLRTQSTLPSRTATKYALLSLPVKERGAKEASITVLDTTEAREEREEFANHATLFVILFLLHHHEERVKEREEKEERAATSATTEDTTAATMEERAARVAREDTTQHPAVTQVHTATATTAVLNPSKNATKSATLSRLVKEREARADSTTVLATTEAREERASANLATLSVTLFRLLLQEERVKEVKEERAAITTAPVTTAGKSPSLDE